jgi:beta-glucosidase
MPFNELRARAGDTELLYVEGYPKLDEYKPQLIEEAVSVAKSADVALLYMALPTSKESEGYDRKDLDLTEHQVSLIHAVVEAQPNTVVILNSGSAIVMQAWIDEVRAVLQGWMMGQAGGGAVADILFGKVNPSGKITETFPIELSDTPAYINWPGGAGEVYYGERIYIGYRYYETKEIPVLFPFGYGLSYTTFEYSNPQVPETFTDKDGLVVQVDVTNTGDVPGKEIVQVYVHDCESTLDRPPKELKGFAKVELEPGQTKTASISLDFRSFAYYHPQYHTWITEDGDFDILFGASSADIRQSARTSMKSTMELPCLLSRESTIKEWLEDPRGAVVFQPMYDQIHSGLEKMFGGDESIGIEVTDMIVDMPLISLLLFQQSALTMPAEDIVDGLLQQAHNTEL